MLFFLLALTTLLSDCSNQTPPGPAYREDGPDIVVIVLDTLRADTLSQYGFALQTSPGLEAFAHNATRFEAAYAPASWTVPSTATIMTGLHPVRHNMHRSGDVLPHSINTLAERLRAAGWRSTGFSHNINIAPKNGFDQGFDRFTTFKGDVFDFPHVGTMLTEVRDWLEVNSDPPAFLYLQPMNCHGPYRVPKSRKKTLLGRAPVAGFKYYKGPMYSILQKGDLAAREKVTDSYQQSLHEQYETAIRYETDVLGQLFSQLKQIGRYDNTLIVLTADHGEELFEHGGFSHGYSLHQEVLRVPLWIKLPGQTQAQVIQDRVSLADITPTILAAVGVPVEAGEMDGRSLKPLLEGGSLPAQPLLFDVKWKRRIVARAVLDGPWKLIDVDQNYEGLKDVKKLYNVQDDPLEMIDLAQSNPEQLAVMQERLEQMVASYKSTITPENVLSEMNAEQLRALGYME